MIYLAHRINSVKELCLVPQKFGVEIDIRTFANQLVLAHDPYEEGELLDSFLVLYRHRFLILNIKCEGIEFKVIELLKKYSIENYFFLDSSFPMIVKMVNKGISNIAIRFSEYESIQTLKHFKDKIEWVWVDCFSKFPLNKTNVQMIQNWGYKICIVSPDLVGRPDDIDTYVKKMIDLKLSATAICTKLNNIAKWQDFYQ